MDFTTDRPRVLIVDDEPANLKVMREANFARHNDARYEWL